MLSCGLCLSAGPLPSCSTAPSSPYQQLCWRALRGRGVRKCYFSAERGCGDGAGWTTEKANPVPKKADTLSTEDNIRLRREVSV